MHEWKRPIQTGMQLFSKRRQSWQAVLSGKWQGCSLIVEHLRKVFSWWVTDSSSRLLCIKTCFMLREMESSCSWLKEVSGNSDSQWVGPNMTMQKSLSILGYARRQREAWECFENWYVKALPFPDVTLTLKSRFEGEKEDASWIARKPDSIIILGAALIIHSLEWLQYKESRVKTRRKGFLFKMPVLLPFFTFSCF